MIRGFNKRIKEIEEFVNRRTVYELSYISGAESHPDNVGRLIKFGNVVQGAGLLVLTAATDWVEVLFPDEIRLFGDGAFIILSGGVESGNFTSGAYFWDNGIGFWKFDETGATVPYAIGETISLSGIQLLLAD